MKEDMKNKVKESVSRVLLIVFFIIVLLSLTITAGPGIMVSIWAFFGFFPVISLLLGVEKHRKIACVGLVFIFLFIIFDHAAGQKSRRHSDVFQNRLYREKISELERKLGEYERSSEMGEELNNADGTDGTSGTDGT